MAKNAKKHEIDQGVSLITLADKASPVSEQYRTIRTNIQYSMMDQELQALVVTSSGPGEGKSTTAANLAVVFANSGKRVLLADADMRKPTVAKTFNLLNSDGLSNVLGRSQVNLDKIIQDSGIPNLSVLTSGPKPPNPSELLGSARMGKLLDVLKRNYDLVIFDMPPVVTVTDAQVLASKVDGTILVAREGITNRDLLKKAKNLLENVDANLLGVVYNGSKRSSDQGYYYG